MTSSTNDATTDEPGLVISRVFAAPRELVWRVLTEAAHLRHWFGPRGWRMRTMSLDLRPGGIFHYALRTRGGEEIWGIIVYREIVPPQRLVYVNSFADQRGNIVRAPFNANWPLQVLNTWTLAEEDGRTTFTVHAIPYNATEAERSAFLDAFSSVRAGWTGTFDVLADYLKTVQSP